MELSKLIGAVEMVDNMVSLKTGYTRVANQFIIYGDKGRAFQSYNTIVAVICNNGNIYLTKDYNCSTTTSKYCNRFLGFLSPKERDTKIKNGKIKIIEISK